MDYLLSVWSGKLRNQELEKQGITQGDFYVTSPDGWCRVEGRYIEFIFLSARTLQTPDQPDVYEIRLTLTHGLQTAKPVPAVMLLPPCQLLNALLVNCVTGNAYRAVSAVGYPFLIKGPLQCFTSKT